MIAILLIKRESTPTEDRRVTTSSVVTIDFPNLNGIVFSKAFFSSLVLNVFILEAYSSLYSSEKRLNWNWSNFKKF